MPGFEIVGVLRGFNLQSLPIEPLVGEPLVLDRPYDRSNLVQIEGHDQIINVPELVVYRQAQALILKIRRLSCQNVLSILAERG